MHTSKMLYLMGGLLVLGPIGSLLVLGMLVVGKEQKAPPKAPPVQAVAPVKGHDAALFQKLNSLCAEMEAARLEADELEAWAARDSDPIEKAALTERAALRRA